MSVPFSFFFFFNDTATTEIYTLSLHDALPISFHRRYPSQWGYFSVEQSRRVMPFSWAYCAAEASIIGRTIDWSDAIQSVSTFHCPPSHCWNLTAPPPSWSMQETLSGCMKPTAPSSFRRLSSMVRDRKSTRLNSSH